MKTAFKGVLVENGTILSREPLSFDPTSITQNDLEILAVHTTPSEKLVLFTKRKQEGESFTLIDLKNGSEKFEWLATFQNAIKNEERVLLYSENEPLNGILGLVKCIRKELGGERTRCFILQEGAPKFAVNAEFYQKQLRKGFAINIYKDNTWGTYRHLLLEETEEVDSKHCFVNAITRGDLSSLKWIEAPMQTESDLELVYVSPILFMGEIPHFLLER